MGADGLATVSASCCVCDRDEAEPIAVGEDFEYRTSADSFLAMKCRSCGLVYLNPRPANVELERIYPPTYHAFDFTPEQFGFVYRVRRRLEARRLLAWCSALGDEARIIDVGCGDGFHLSVLAEYGKPHWIAEGIDTDERAVRVARERGLAVTRTRVQELDANGRYDLALLVQTIEHVDDPDDVLRSIHRILRPGGRLVIVTDNTRSIDASLFRGRHWGGYHFPRHWNLFNAENLRQLAEKTGFRVVRLRTAMSPVNWVYSVRNALVDYGAPPWMFERFSLNSAPSLAAFTVLDAALTAAGRGALLCAIVERPR